MASPGAIVAIILLVIGGIGCIGAIGIILQRRFGSSSRAAYNPFADPTPNRGPFSWVGDRVRQFKAKSSRTATGAYEGDTMYRTYPDDDAWDHRVGREADGFGPYDEEHEMGAVGGGGRHGPGANAGAGPYAGATGDLGAPGAGQQVERGRSRTRSPPRVQVENPFGDNAEPSNIDSERANKAKKGRQNISSDRRSVFREAVE